MSIAQRRKRQREERYGLILAAARQLAEAEGWDAVTTRRLAGLIDYSQPVLYSHFKNKAEIMAAVATQGFEELAACLKKANAAGPPESLRRVCAAYLDFARSKPVIFEAMFVLPTTLAFASEATPAALRAGFSEFVIALGPNRPRPDVTAEVLWSALHGMVALERSQRIPAAYAEARLNALVQMFSGAPHQDASGEGAASGASSPHHEPQARRHQRP